MAVVPKFFRQAGDPIIASYDFVDVAEGTGIVLFYGLTTFEAKTYGFRLSREVMRSQLIDSNLTSGIAAPVEEDLNFDLTPYNLPQVVKGTAYLNCCLGTGGAQGFASGSIIRLRGVTETLIGQASSAILLTGTKQMLMKIICTETEFKKDDVLRLKLGVVKTAGNDTTTIELGHDPANRDADNYIKPVTVANDTTQVKLWVPFKIDA